MATFFMFGRYSTDALKDMSAKRTEESIELIKKFGGEVKSMHAMLGEYDLIFQVDFPDFKTAMKVSVVLNKLTGIRFVTSQTMGVEEFDNLVAGI